MRVSSRWLSATAHRWRDPRAIWPDRSAPPSDLPALKPRRRLRTLLHQPRFAPDAVEQQKQQALTGIKSIAQPAALADQLFMKPSTGSSYGHPPEVLLPSRKSQRRKSGPL